MKAETFAELAKLGHKIATELTFAEAGKDLGLLPVNSLLCQIGDLIGSEPAAQPLVEAVKQARGWIDEVFQGAGTFSAPILEQLGAWTESWQDSISACENQRPPAPKAKAPPEIPAATGQEPTLTLNLEQDRELLAEFINEAQEHLQNIEQGVLVLEKDPQDEDTLNSIFRAFHTFKGGSGFLSLTAVQTLAHELESLLDLARQHKLAITPPVINLILEGGDTLRRFRDEINRQVSGQEPAGPIVVPTLGLLGRIRAALSGEETKIEPPGSGPPPADAPKPAPEVSTAQRPKAESAASVVKVDTAKLDSLVDLVGEMLIAQSMVAQNQCLVAIQNEQLTRDLAQFNRISKELQRTVMSLRMVPLHSTFQKMNRLVRDLGLKVGKQVELVTEGDDTELDRTITEELGDPLVHMIRNSVDHGIEKPEDRIKRGKPAKGTILLKAFHRGGNIVIEIKDDGNGLDCGRIRAKAIEKGLLAENDQPSENDLFKLIMAPGFSTAEKVTDLSGRGVGMDVVRRNIEKLRGKIEIQSEPGHGSTFSIHLPLTLAIIDGLLIGVGEQRYVVPTLLVRESFRPAREMIHTLHERGEMINLRGRLIPLVRLHSLLDIQPATTDPAQSIVVVVEAGCELRCLLVDTLLGKHEVVIKSLGETFSQNKYLAGAAILGDGRVGLILDPQALAGREPSAFAAAA